MKKKAFHYKTSCLESTYKKINDMRDHPKRRKVKYETMLAACDGLLDFAEDYLGYERDRRNGLTLRQDKYVSYYSSVYGNKPCYYMVHSSIEYIWVENRHENNATAACQFCKREIV